MGTMLTSIESEEKALRLQERRNNIYDEIKEIEDIKDEYGVARLKHLTEKFEHTFEEEDGDDEGGQSDKNVIYTKMPWADLDREEDKNQLEKECKLLSKKEDLLLKLSPHLEYQFDFDLDKYTFLAIVLSAMDERLNEVYIRLVPDEVSEEEFWRNYFYHVELQKMKSGWTHRLGDPVNEAAREAAVQDELKKAEEEIEALKQSEIAEQVTGTQKVAVGDSGP